MQQILQQLRSIGQRWPFAGPVVSILIALTLGWAASGGAGSDAVSPLAALPLLVAVGITASPWVLITGGATILVVSAHTMARGAALPLADLAVLALATGIAGAVQGRLGGLRRDTASAVEAQAQATAQIATQEALRRRAERILEARRGVFTPFAEEASRALAETQRLIGAMGDAWRQGDREQAEAIERRLRHMLRRHQAATQNLLDGEHLARGQELALRRSPVPLHTLARNLAQQLGAPAKAANITVVVEAPPDLSPAWGDPSRIERVVDTLIHNAWQATLERGSGGTITIAVTQEPSRLRWAVHDTGVGIEAETLRQLQHRCVRALLPGSEGEGIGGGLTLMALLVSAMGGDLTISSSGRNLGTTVEFTLPVADQPVAAPRPRATRPPVVTPPTIPAPPAPIT